MTNATMEYVLGLGGLLLDPGGASALCRRVTALGVNVPTPYPQHNLRPVYDAIKGIPCGDKLYLSGDSCGCTRIIQLAKAISPRAVDGLYCIQSSYWCQMGAVPIGDNVKEAIIFYSSWLLTGGLGVYKPSLVVPPKVATGESLYDGKTRVGNNGRTKVTYLYVPNLHPGDNDATGVQDPIVNHIKQTIPA